MQFDAIDFQRVSHDALAVPWKRQIIRIWTREKDHMTAGSGATTFDFTPAVQSHEKEIVSCEWLQVLRRNKKLLNRSMSTSLSDAQFNG